MRAQDTGGEDSASEMAIVDTFTKLIFGEEEHFDDNELLIIQALRLVDSSVSRDSYRELGQYLRALGVEEMVQLVARVQQGLTRGQQLPPRDRNRPAHALSTRH